MISFLQMGGFARYVWPAFGLTAVLMTLNIAWARRTLRQAQLEARRRLQHYPAGNAHSQTGARS